MDKDYGFYYDKMANAFQETEWIRQMYLAFNGLQGALKVDGNQWCANTGDWPEHNITGFGDTPEQAMRDWYKSYSNQKAVKHLINSKT